MKKLICWIVVSKLMTLAIILYAGIGLMPDEAQYWTWSKELSYGYYSKPPGIAWQIALGCFFFGDNELGVRVGSLVLSFFLSLAIYRLARTSGLDKERSELAAIAFSFCPLGVFSGFFATTDCAYVLFWAVVAGLIAKDLSKKRSLSFVSVGICIAIGALWKWPIYAIWVPILLFFYREPLRVVWGFLISLLGLVPSLIWNMQHGFVTFHHVKASIDNVASRANPLEFLGAQALLVSPILFVLIVIAMCRFREKERSFRFCWFTALLFFAVIFIASCVEKVQGNWAVAAYPTAFVIMMLFAFRKWVVGGIILSVAMVSALFLFPIPYRINPFKPGLGNEALKEALVASGYDLEKDFLFSDRYQGTSLLSFYGPKQKRAYFLNINNLRHNQFDFWPQMKDECLSKTGYFVEFASGSDARQSAEALRAKLLPYFSKVTILPARPLYFHSGCEEKVAIILRATEYNGMLPQTENKY